MVYLQVNEYKEINRVRQNMYIEQRKHLTQIYKAVVCIRLLKECWDILQFSAEITIP